MPMAFPFPFSRPVGNGGNGTTADPLLAWVDQRPAWETSASRKLAGRLTAAVVSAVHSGRGRSHSIP